jgi:hypothetical protein
VGRRGKRGNVVAIVVGSRVEQEEGGRGKEVAKLSHGQCRESVGCSVKEKEAVVDVQSDRQLCL